MPPIEQAKRMRVMRANVSAFDASWWARQIVRDAACATPAHAVADEAWSAAVA
jgi:trehalose-6-phosphate synthase